MKKNYKLFLSVLLCVVFNQTTWGQQGGQPVYLGKSKEVLDLIRQKTDPTLRREGKPKLSFNVTSSTVVNVQVNYQRASGDGQYVIGEVENGGLSDFYIKADKNAIEGNIVLRDSQKAYKFYSDEQGNSYVKEVDINGVVCINFDKQEASTGTAPSSGTATASAAVLDLQSMPGAPGCVLLDFDGQYVSGTPWNNGNPIDAQPSGMSDAAIQEVWELVSEDYRPFNMNITTSETVFNTYPKNRRMRCIITPTNTAAPGSGGVAYLNSFTWNDDTPCWVFLLSAKTAGEAASHEVGHTLSLSHDGRTSPAESYYAGQGTWAPIMGVGYYKSVTQWSKGEYANANNKEDDLAKISSTTNGLGYKTDDHGNAITSATALVIDASGNVSAASNKGIIERTTDIDMFTFTTSGGAVSLTFNPAARHGDLDILATLYNSAGTVLGTYNPSGLSATLSTTLASGTYYISIDGTGTGDPATTGYSDYASLGYFSISGTIPVTAGNQAPQVAISGPANGASFVAPASISITANASDADGSVAKVEFYNGTAKLGEDVSAPYSFIWSNVAAGSYSLTAVATDNAGAVATSAAVAVTVTTTPVNQSPVVSITSPSGGASYIAPATITINANASDPDGTVAKVEFYNGTTKLGEDLSSPYSFTWSNVVAGSYSLTARATDNAGAVTTSAAVTVTVTSSTVTYCASKGSSTRYEFINNVTLGSINNTSGNNSGYRDYTTLTTPLSAGGTYSIYFTPGFTGSTYTEYWSVWIDYNKDGDFADAGERVGGGSTTGSGNYYVSFTVPSTIVAGRTRLRISMKYSGTPTACETFSYGEVEDYSVDLSTTASGVAAAAPVGAEPVSDGAVDETGILLHPNPAQSLLNINAANVEEATIGKIADMNGTVFKTFELGHASVTIDIHDLPAGVYVVIIKSERTEVTRKFIKL